MSLNSQQGFIETQLGIVADNVAATNTEVLDRFEQSWREIADKSCGDEYNFARALAGVYYEAATGVRMSLASRSKLAKHHFHNVKYWLRKAAEFKSRIESGKEGVQDA
jgi:hypothetical protein